MCPVAKTVIQRLQNQCLLDVFDTLANQRANRVAGSSMCVGREQV
ncbi:hypothetical protein ACIDI_21c00160 [Acidiphilium sp. JA12-A1]|nr:hypothetical protein ACIDI_21c00160 [Acidiphilium sp. JA12-A1]